MPRGLKGGQGGWGVVGEKESIKPFLEKHEVGQSRWDIINRGKESGFHSIFSRKSLENHKQESDIKFTFLKKLLL